MALLDIVRCPKCGGGMTEDAKTLSCAGCSAAYPRYGGTPWLYRDVAGSRAQWADKLQHLDVTTNGEVEQLQAALQQPDLMGSTRERIERLVESKKKLAGEIHTLLEPFELEKTAAARRLPRDRIPSKQHLSSYIETIFRDWAWGDDEVSEALELVEARLEAPPTGSALVLGGGAGRLSYELACLGGWQNVAQLDINPLLSRAAALLSAGKEVLLTEIPYPPAGIMNVTVDHILKNPSSAAKSPLHFLIGDVFAPPFAPETFDVLITPWFVDILPDDFRSLSRRLNQLLRADGLWVNFGPLSFESVPTAGQYSREEVEEAIEDSGMALVASENRRVRYLHSPHSTHKRCEEILVFSARKTCSAAADAEYAYYPRWMSDPTRSIPALPAWQQMHSQRVFDVEILGLIDGRASIQDIVKRLSSKYSLPADRCRNVVNRFFSTVFEKGLE